MSFLKVCAVTAILYLRVQMEISLYFLQFSFNLDKTDIEDSPKKNLLSGCFSKISTHSYLT